MPARWAAASALEQVAGQVVDHLGVQRAVGPHLVGQGAAAEVGHHQHDVVALVDHLEQRDDAGMVERSQRGGLAADPLAGAVHVVDAAVEGEPLDGHGPSVGVEGEVDDAHAAASQSLHGRVDHR